MSMKTGILALFFAPMLTACSKPSPAPMPTYILECPEEPRPSQISTEREFLNWVEEMRSAGAVCRANLFTTSQILTVAYLKR